MSTTVTFYENETNLDYLMGDVRFVFGDLTGSIYSDTIIRTSLVNAVKFLQNKWESRYQIFSPTNVISSGGGVTYANTVYGAAYIPNGLAEGSAFRDPFSDDFTQDSPPVIQSYDETPIILAAVLLLRRSQVSSSAVTLVSWGTEDIRYSNLSAGSQMSSILAGDLMAFNEWFKERLASPQILNFEPIYNE